MRARQCTGGRHPRLRLGGAPAAIERSWLRQCAGHAGQPASARTQANAPAEPSDGHAAPQPRLSCESLQTGGGGRRQRRLCALAHGVGGGTASS
eukprot:6182055-Pleurochrysis_carterae.AAC.1